MKNRREAEKRRKKKKEKKGVRRFFLTQTGGVQSTEHACAASRWMHILLFRCKAGWLGPPPGREEGCLTASLLPSCVALFLPTAEFALSLSSLYARASHPAAQINRTLFN